MASSSSYSHKPNNNKNKNKSPVNSSKTDGRFKNTTFVYVDPSNFSDVVQKLTGASSSPTSPKLPITVSPLPLNGKHNSMDVGPIRPSFKLQEQQSSRNLEVQLNQNGLTHGVQSMFSPRKIVMNASPLSKLDTFLAQWSPRTPVSPFMKEEIAMVNKNFFLQSASATSKKVEPKLLPLFPISWDY